MDLFPHRPTEHHGVGIILFYESQSTGFLLPFQTQNHVSLAVKQSHRTAG